MKQIKKMINKKRKNREEKEGRKGKNIEKKRQVLKALDRSHHRPPVLSNSIYGASAKNHKILLKQS